MLVSTPFSAFLRKYTARRPVAHCVLTRAQASTSTHPAAAAAPCLPHTTFPGRVSDEVRGALAAGGAVVALESTIVAHGMPWPRNLEAALDVERLIRAAGAVPATVAVVRGVPTVGLSPAELEALARGGPDVAKCSTRELPLAVSRRTHGATTVAATAHLAVRAGVEVFVTGGVGGVHRGASESGDVSADLVALSDMRLTGGLPSSAHHHHGSVCGGSGSGGRGLVVVCAGVKSILDIGRTLEYLETMGVPVVGYGTDEFPAFFSPYSGFPCPARLDSPLEVARHHRASLRLGLRAATLLAVPNPSPAHDVEAAIHEALEAAAREGVRGAATTPFLLGRVSAVTEGRSLDSNVALVRHNARVGAQVALAIAAEHKMEKEEEEERRPPQQ